MGNVRLLSQNWRDHKLLILQYFLLVLIRSLQQDFEDYIKILNFSFKVKFVNILFAILLLDDRIQLKLKQQTKTVFGVDGTQKQKIWERKNVFVKCDKLRIDQNEINRRLNFKKQLFTIMRNIGIDQLLYINNQTKIMFSTEQVALPQLSNAKSADCLKLDLNYKISKKSEIKLLNAKLRKLKNRCRALREQSKTDRQFLSNLLTATSQLQSKTNDGIQACKQVCTEMLDNHAEMRQQKAKSSLAQIANHALDLALESNCDRDKTMDVQKEEQLIDQKLQIIALIENYQDKINIHSIPTDRSITASVKSQTNKEDRQFLEEEESKNTMSGNTCENSAAGETQIKRANTISFSPSKSKIYRKASLFLTQRKKEKIKIRSDNLFTKYVYTIVCTILLTIIFFKLIVF